MGEGRSRFRLVFLLVLVLRLAMAFAPVATYDAISYSIVAQAVSSGQSVYAATARYNYSPVWSFLLRGLWAAAGGRLALFVLLIGLLLNLSDVFSAFAVQNLARGEGRSEPEARRAALLFFANPVSVIVTCYVRQFDGVAILFLLLALRLAAARPARKWIVSASLAASLLVKHVAALHPLLFEKRRRGGVLGWPLVAAPYAVFALSFVPYLASSSAIFDHVVLYGTGLGGAAGQRPGGLQGWLAFPAGSKPVFFGFLIAGLGAALWLGRRRPLPQAALLLFLAQLVFAPGFAAQYLLWPIALGSVAASGGYVLATTLGSLFMATEAGLLPVPFAVTATAAWTAALLWFLQEAGAGFESRTAAFGVQTSSTASG